MLIDELLDAGEQHARKVLLTRRDKELAPFYHLVAPNDHAVVPCQWSNDIQKQIQVAAVKKIARDMGAVAAMFAGEAWMVKLEGSGAKRKLDMMDPPSQHPQRIEVVSLIATDGKNTRQRALRIIRDKPGGRIISLIKEGETQSGDFSGRLIDGIICNGES